MQTDRDIQNLVDFVKFIEQNDLLGNDPILIAKQFIYPSAKFLALGKPEPLAKNKDSESCTHHINTLTKMFGGMYCDKCKSYVKI